MHTTDGVWLSITDYSLYKKVSISTIRRHIKNNILKHKEEDGKYFIYVANSERIKLREEEELLRLKLENELLKTHLRQAREEAIGLRMLVDLYEQKTTPVKNMNQEPPELPVLL
jgi:DNA-binding transcriptional ArsR family regulator